MNKTLTFSQYLNHLLAKENISGREAVRQLNEAGIYQTKSSFFNYLNGDTVPKLNNAYNILLFFNEDIKLNDAQILINNGIKAKPELNSDNKRHILLKLDEDDESLLNERLIEYGNLTKYVNVLIKKDLNKLRKELNYEI